MTGFIPYGRQWISDDDIEEVVKVLRSDWLTQGPAVDDYETALAEYFGSKYAVACSSGTAALHLACLAAGIGPGDVVLTSPITFVATANCALYVGARPDFVDVTPDTICLGPDKLAEALADWDPAKGRPRAVIPVHFAGHPADMVKIQQVAKEHDLIVIEDACHAWGAQYRGQRQGSPAGDWNKVGACADSDMAVFSSHPLKHITTGEGGVITTNREDLFERLRLMRSHGITRDPAKLSRTDDPWYYEMQELGYNYRITDFQAALGRSQLSRLDDFVARRRAVAAQFDAAFAPLPGLSIPFEAVDARSAYHIYPVRLGNPGARAQVAQSLLARGIGTNMHYIPVHLQPYYGNKFGYVEGDYPCAEDFYAGALTLPLFAAMDDSQADRVIEAVTGVISGL